MEWRAGALFGSTPDEAFYVKCDDETNPAEGIDAGQVVCEIGVAPVKPAEFVIFRLAQFSGGTSLVSEYRSPTADSLTHRKATSMALPEGDSSVGHSFGLEFDGITIKSITEVAGLKMEQDVVEYKENGPDGKYQIRRLPGPAQGARHHPDPRPDRGQQLREVDQGQPVRQDGRRPQGRRDHRLRLRGQRGQALQADQRVAEEPGDRHA